MERKTTLNLDDIGDRTAEKAIERWNSLAKDFEEDE